MGVFLRGFFFELFVLNSFFGGGLMKNLFSFEPPLLNPLFFGGFFEPFVFLGGFNLFLLVNPHCFRFLIFEFYFLGGLMKNLF
ncbi:hypothetical protein HPAG1_1185 [Helicobacter pylori HPAG1]|nr:hypothetical protein HPAG1_1185 [Helicobacter pylori HPAG1]